MLTGDLMPLVVLLDITERRTLSSDGQTLTIETSRNTPRGNQTFTLVYQKAT